MQPDNLAGAESRSRSLSLIGGSRDTSRLKSAQRMFRLLDLISLQEGLTAKALSKRLGVSLSTCYCLINILVEEGYVEKISCRKGYRLGPAISLLHARAHNIDVDARVGPVVGELAASSNRHAYLGLLSEGDVTVARVEEPRRRPPVELIRASSGASHALAVGKILLAGMGSEEIEEYADRHGLEAFTSRTITDLVQLEAHLTETQGRGFATDLEEFSENLCCVAAPIVDKSGKVEGAIGLSTTSRHFYRESEALIGLVSKAGREASALLK